MTQTDLLNPHPDALFARGSQNWRIYDKMREWGAILNSEIAQMGCLSHTRRISDIREALKPFAKDVEAHRVRRGLWKYKIKG